MKKQKRQFFILICLCILCIAGYFWIRGGYLEEEDTVSEAAVTDFQPEDVVALSVSGDVSLDFVKENGEWQETSLPDESISQSSVTGLLSQISNISTAETVVESPENLAQYGLEEPVRTILVTFADDTSMSISVGTQSSLLNKYYIQVSEDPNVYLVSSYVVTDFEKSPEDFVEIVEEETETDVEEETLTVEDGAAEN